MKMVRTRLTSAQTPLVSINRTKTTQTHGTATSLLTRSPSQLRNQAKPQSASGVHCTRADIFGDGLKTTTAKAIRIVSRTTTSRIDVASPTGKATKYDHTPASVSLMIPLSIDDQNEHKLLLIYHIYTTIANYARA